MRKELITSLIFTVAYFLLISLIRNWLDFMYLPFWLGGLLGAVLPLVDYVIYVYVLKRPDGTVSNTTAALMERKALVRNMEHAARIRTENTGLIFHTAYFQLVFVLFTFWMMSSSGSLFGMGLVLAFLLHLLIDQVNDFMEKGTIKNWFVRLNVNLSQKEEKIYLFGQVLFLLVLGFLI